LALKRCYRESPLLGTVRQLFHYPVKGLSAQALPSVALQAGEGFPHDRIFGFARHDSGFDPADPQPMPKSRFFVLAQVASLAGLQSHLDTDTLQLQIRRDGTTVFEDTLATADGRDRAVAFLAHFLELQPDQQPVFAQGQGNRFTDVSVVSREMMNAVSLINLDSVRDFSQRTGREVDHRRFRANLYFDGWPAFSELARIGHTLSIGTVRLRICKETKRCPATEVNPDTADRDLRVPRLLLDHYGHPNMGVYAEVLSAGVIRTGDVIKMEPSPR
jgi:uncharacterized protein YcbX